MIIKHYVVMLDWASQDAQDVVVIGMAHSLEKAKEIFDKQVQHEKHIAEMEEYEIFEDSDTCFEAYEKGYWNNGHCKLWIQEVDVTEE